MALLTSNFPTLTDMVARQLPDGSIDPDIVELLCETNDVVMDAPWKEANGYTEHTSTIRTGIPNGTFRKLYGGVQPEKSTTARVKDSMGMLESYAEIDKALLDLNDTSAEWRRSEESAFVEGLSQTFAETLFYGDAGLDPEKFTGLTSRYNSLSAENALNILDAGGTGSDNASIWLLGWGKPLHGIYPKGSKAGLSVEDLGRDTATDANGGRFEIVRTHFKWDCGITLSDWRYCVRIANIDVSDLTKNASAGADLIDLLTQAVELLPNCSGGAMARPHFYMNRKLRSFLRRQMVNKVASSTLTMMDVLGKQVPALDTIPLRRCDALLSTEARVV